MASVPGLTLLKLSAWADRGLESNKDAADLRRLFTTYADAGNTDRLYDREIDLLETAGFDMELAGAELLGRDVATICESRVLRQIRALVETEPSRERLARHMLQNGVYGMDSDAAPAMEGIVNGFCRGLGIDGKFGRGGQI